MGKLKPLEVKEFSGEAAVQKEQTVPTYEQAQKHRLGHVPECREKAS